MGHAIMYLGETSDALPGNKKGDPKAATVLQQRCSLLCLHLAPREAESGKAEGQQNNGAGFWDVAEV